ncbi:MAG: Gfo/Idh/MocA family oxidoreductase [Pirellulaceae bacterium]|nr:Gfo/Idh/MocA family oxidoreductase [Pirellulaceae bacterium]
MPSAALCELEYRPQSPGTYCPRIGLIGCGGITAEHLAAYRDAQFNIAALCDLRMDQARLRAAQYFPDAKVYQDYRQLLRDESLEVVDVTTHPAERLGIVRDCLLAGKHVLSQKPFVTDIQQGQRLVELAQQQNVLLAVNQNARWAPHYRWAYSAVQAGLLGELFAVHLGCHWDHTWVEGTEFEKIRHVVLYDFGIHWFDLVRYFLGGAMPRRVFASTARVPGQKLSPNLLAQVLLEFDSAQATLVFDAGVRIGPWDHTYLAGTKGSLRSTGPNLHQQSVELHVAGGSWQPELTGRWFPDGFRGTMSELLCAIHEGRQPCISAADNLKSLQLCFAALASADTGQPVIPGSINRLPD